MTLLRIASVKGGGGLCIKEQLERIMRGCIRKRNILTTLECCPEKAKDR